MKELAAFLLLDLSPTRFGGLGGAPLSFSKGRAVWVSEEGSNQHQKKPSTIASSVPGRDRQALRIFLRDIPLCVG